jgi:hypothetical protein
VLSTTVAVPGSILTMTEFGPGTAATFRAVQDNVTENQVNIYLAKPPKFEKVPGYTLMPKVRNAPDLSAEAQLNIKVKDVLKAEEKELEGSR